MARIVISDVAYAQIIEHARACWPEEACGLVAGRIETAGPDDAWPVSAEQAQAARAAAADDAVPAADRIPAYIEADDVVKVVERVYPVENVDHSREHFTIDPRDQLAVLKEARAEGLALLGNFHSHPDTPARPSAEDKRLSNDVRASYIIVSLAGDDPQLNAFHVEGDQAWREPVVALP